LLQNLLEELHEVANAASEDRDMYSLFQDLNHSFSCLAESTQQYKRKKKKPPLHPRGSYGVLAAYLAT
jgi:hypothetical protein